MASKRIVRRVALERCSRPLLARLLSAHAAAFFSAHGFPVEALGASSASDRTLVHRLFELLHTPSLEPALPASFRALLAAFDALATPQGGEEIIRFDTDALLPRATYGDEDLALHALLTHPELAAEARRAAEADRVQSFTEYEPAAPGPLVFAAAEKAALVVALGPRLASKDRTGLCQVHVTRDGHAVSLEIVHARRPRTFDKVDARVLEIEASTDIHAERAFVELDTATGQLAIHAAVAVKDLLRAALGEVLASRVDFFRAARVYDLSPLKDLDAVLSIEDAPPRLRKVEVHALAVQTVLGSVVTFARSRKSLLGDAALRDPVKALLEHGVPVGVKLYLTIDGRERPLKVELSVNGKKNRIDFDREDTAVVEVVRGYLRARGILRDVEAEAEADESSAPGPGVPSESGAPASLGASDSELTETA